MHHSETEPEQTSSPSPVVAAAETEKETETETNGAKEGSDDQPSTSSKDVSAKVSRSNPASRQGREGDQDARKLVNGTKECWKRPKRPTPIRIRQHLALRRDQREQY
ncbi:uncharacterized protein MEPE_04931 [Melanopsichium pennsylvanicum]|uniref:Uncharacterized protein n=1 Tax=Melanopsichium pennsylvanicum TaxID=63383 RepID=A0AAJ5C6U5_9BASI|nr:uncharacterized protein MEPE_04931 [Melanopsichium pennsylvanicum]